jgi:G:T/U-mismatch repair DNA glycosylase
MKQTHPYEPYVPENATKLVIGSIPPPRFCGAASELRAGDVDWYYGSDKNGFWNLINPDAAKTKSVDKLKEYLNSLGVGITDIVRSCIRNKPNSALDKDLEICERKDISTLLKKHPIIDTLIYTSRFVLIQVEKSLGIKHVPTETEKKFKITIAGKEYTAWVLYSPSPAALRGMGPGGAQKRAQLYQEIFRGLY